MISACRILLLLVFALFWGGLTFYTGFVVRISHDVLDDPMTGGLITQRVTALLQILGVVAAVVMACNAVVVFRQSRRFGIALGLCASVLGCALVGLFVVHGQLDAVIDLETSTITDRDVFVVGHRRYNQITTIQWLTSLAYVPITVFAWRSNDTRSNQESSAKR